MRNMLFELSEPCFGSTQARLQAGDLGAAGWLDQAIVDMRNEKYR